MKRLWYLTLLVWPLTLRADDTAALAQQHFRSGLAYERLGRFEEAYTEVQLAANFDPQSSEIALAVGVLASRLNHYDEAVRALEHSVVLNANSCASYFQLGLLYEKNQMDERAFESWQRFFNLTQDPMLRQVAQKHMGYLEGRK